MKRWSRLLYFLPAAAHYGFIFYLSAQSSFPIEAPFAAFDKIAHAGLFALLGFLLSLGADRGTRLSSRKRVWIVLLLGIALGLLDEFHQEFVPSRFPDILDAAVDAAGIILGWIAYGFLSRAMSARRERIKGSGRGSGRISSAFF
jgi:VanZ family protein